MRRAGRTGAGPPSWWCAAALIAVAGAAGCASAVVRPESRAPVSIDMEPRCGPQPTGVVVSGLAPPATASARGGDAPAPDRVETLPRGVRWFADAAPHAGLATLAWGFPAPALSDGADREAQLRLVAALLQSGETAANPEAFRARIGAAGARRVARAEEGWLWLGLRFPETQRERAFRLLLEWADPQPIGSIDEVAFERVRRSAALAQLAERGSAKALAQRAFERVHPPPRTAVTSSAPGPARAASGAQPGGVHDTRRGGAHDTRAALARLFEATLRPEGSVLVYSGAADPTALRRALERELLRREESGEARPAARAAVAVPVGIEPAAPAPARSATPHGIYIVDRPGSPQAEVLVGMPTVGPRDPDFAALEVLASLLGGNVGGRLFRDLRERHGLAYIIDAEQSVDARFVVTTRARHERIAALVAGIEAHLRALVEVPLAACEVEMLERRMRGEQALVADDPKVRVEHVRADFELRDGPRTPAARVEAYRAAIRGGLEAVARRHLARDPTVVLVGDGAWLQRDLTRAFPGRHIEVLDE